MSILDTIKFQTNSLDDLAALPQAMIMQMAQKGQIREDMLAPILGRKAEMAEAVARTRALQSQGAPMPTVMEQLMQRNAQAEMPEAREMGVAQLPIPDDMYGQGMAGGGIVAFEDGGSVEDDDEESEYYQEAIEEAQMEDMLNKVSMSGFGRMAPRTGGIGIATPKREENAPKIGLEPTGGDYKMYAAKMAEKYDVDPEVIIRMMAKETGGLKNPEVAVSPKGAVGVMQLMPATAKELGVANPTNPYENIEGGVKYFSRLEKKYNDPQLAMIAYNWGPGNTDKWLKSGADITKLPKETRKYIDMMAEGGEVRSFQTGGMSYTDPLDYFSGMDPESLAMDEIRRQRELDKYKALYGTDKAVRPSKTKQAEPEVKTSGYMQGDDTYIPELNTGSRGATMAKPQETAPVKPEDPFTKALARFEERQNRMKESAAEDKNLALLAAGLGMMGGTSPYALTNIGAGGAKGVEQYAASRRARTAEELANEKLLGATLKAKEFSDIRQLNAKALEESRLRDDYLAARKQIEANVMSRYKGDPSLFDAKTKAKVAQEIQDALNSDEYFRGLSEKMGLKVGTGKPTTIGSYNLKSGLNLNK